MEKPKKAVLIIDAQYLIKCDEAKKPRMDLSSDGIKNFVQVCANELAYPLCRHAWFPHQAVQSA